MEPQRHIDLSSVDPVEVDSGEKSGNPSPDVPPEQSEHSVLVEKPNVQEEQTESDNPATLETGVAASTNKPQESTQQPSEEFFPLDSQALARFAQRTSVIIATISAIPDAVALLPGATSALGWLLQLIGLWISAAVLWFVGFLAILQAARLVLRGVYVGTKGIKIWRIARVITWERLEAVSVTEQTIFSRIFSLKPPAMKLTLYSRLLAEKNILKIPLIPVPVASYFFSAETFEKLARSIILRKFNQSPSSIEGTFCIDAPLAQAQLRLSQKASKIQALIVQVILIVGVCGVLGRKAMVNYVYNSGNQAMAARNFVEAENLYRQATEIDPFFYAPYNNLANAEFRRGEFAQALKHWEKALKLKPDFVEPMISISYLHLQKGENARAKELINSALLLAPLNSYALVNRADYHLRMGNLKPAKADAENVLAHETKDKRPIYTAQCIHSETLIRSGKVREGLKKLTEYAKNFNEPEFNRTMWLLANAEGLMAADNYKAARDTAMEAQRRAGDSRDVLIKLGRISAAKNDLTDTDMYVRKLAKLSRDDPWTTLLQANVLHMQGKNDEALACVERAMQLSHDDALLYAESGKLLKAMHLSEKAKDAARKALELEPLTDSAMRLLDSLK